MRIKSMILLKYLFWYFSQWKSHRKSISCYKDGKSICFELVGIYSFLPLIPIHQLGIKFITALTADVYIAAKFP